MLAARSAKYILISPGRHDAQEAILHALHVAAHRHASARQASTCCRRDLRRPYSDMDTTIMIFAQKRRPDYFELLPAITDSQHRYSPSTYHMEWHHRLFYFNKPVTLRRGTSFSNALPKFLTAYERIFLAYKMLLISAYRHVTRSRLALVSFSTFSHATHFMSW